MNVQTSHIKDIEVELLIDAIQKRYGYDYSGYQRESLQRRFEMHCRESGITNIAEMIPRVLRDEHFFTSLFLNLSVTVTEMFRDPKLYRALREKVTPWLKTFPYINIWNAGCATGEEAYSAAIIMEEEDLLKRSQIYATDINDRSLKTGRKGIYPIREMRHYTHNYNRAGGKKSLADYYHTKYSGILMNKALKNKITFSKHNLVTDGVFAEMHLVMCKNVLIYFNDDLQNRVLKLLTDSLCYNGFLCLGDKESIQFSSVADQYEVVDSEARIYKKKYPIY